MPPLGKKRRVVEVLDKSRQDREYRFRVRFDCGHTTTVTSRVSATHVPAAGFCRNPQCINPEAA